MKLIAIALLITLILIGATSTQPIMAQAPEVFSIIFIQEDGSITCSNVPDLTVIPIKREGETYTLTGNIKSFGAGIAIGRNGITLDGAGYTLQGSTKENNQGGQGISFATSVTGVTVKNLKITNFETGVSLNMNSGNTFTQNEVSDNEYNGFYLSGPSSNNTINANTISNNPRWGIIIVGREPTYGGPCTGNKVFNNTIQGNGWQRWTILSYGMNNSYGAGVWLWAAVDNTFYNNKFTNNAQQAFIFDQGANTWSNGLPTGGNLWSDYNGTDTNGDGIGDTQYLIDSANSDPYPLIVQSSTTPPPNETENSEDSQIPNAYIIATAAAGIAIAIIVFLLFFMKRKRKPTNKP